MGGGGLFDLKKGFTISSAKTGLIICMSLSL